jgi:hypothetical protein
MSKKKAPAKAKRSMKVVQGKKAPSAKITKVVAAKAAKQEKSKPAVVAKNPKVTMSGAAGRCQANGWTIESIPKEELHWLLKQNGKVIAAEVLGLSVEQLDAARGISRKVRTPGNGKLPRPVKGERPKYERAPAETCETGLMLQGRKSCKASPEFRVTSTGKVKEGFQSEASFDLCGDHAKEVETTKAPAWQGAPIVPLAALSFRAPKIAFA